MAVATAFGRLPWRFPAGATVLRGTEGFGGHGVVHKAALLSLGTDQPVVVEIVDAEGKMRAFVPELEGMLRGGTATMEYVSTLVYRHAGPAAVAELPDHPGAIP